MYADNSNNSPYYDIMQTGIIKTIYAACSILLLIACFSLPIEFYTFLRIIIFVSIIIILGYDKNIGIKWKLLLLVIGVVFNPLVPLYLYKKTLWIPIDLISSGIFLLLFKQKFALKTNIHMEEKILETTEIKDKITYHAYGFKSAQHAKSMPESVVYGLDNVYETFIEEQKLDAKGIKDRIDKLKAEVQQARAKKHETQAEIATCENLKLEKGKQIEELELEKIDIRNGEGDTGDTIPFVIGTFITILLTFYLFTFYSSSGYAALYGVKEGNISWISNPFAEISGGSIAIVILFPVIFLGLGFLIHDALEKNKKLVAQNKPKKFLTIGLLLFITLIADAFIGYKISQGVHNNEYNAGLIQEQWHYTMVFSDINFYIVLLLGFVVYVIWGFLLNFVLSHPYLKTENEKIKLLLENIDRKIDEKRTELAEIVAKINSQSNLLLSLDDEISGKGNDIIGYENGVIPVNIPSLRAAVGGFMGGWGTYTHGFFGLKAEDMLKQAEQRKEEWQNNKILTIKTEYSSGK